MYFEEEDQRLTRMGEQQQLKQYGLQQMYTLPPPPQQLQQQVYQ